MSDEFVLSQLAFYRKYYLSGPQHSRFLIQGLYDKYLTAAKARGLI